MELEIKGDIQRLHLEPNDILVIHHDSSGYRYESFRELAHELADKLHEIGIKNKMLVVDNSVNFYIVSSEEIDNGC